GRLYGQAILWYERGKQIRLRLRDPRMVAQSDIRIAQCQLSLAKILRRGGDADRAQKLVREAEDLSYGVARLYEQTPPEEHRRKALEQIWAGGDDLYRELAALAPPAAGANAEAAVRDHCLRKVQCLLGRARIARARGDRRTARTSVGQAEAERARLR